RVAEWRREPGWHRDWRRLHDDRLEPRLRPGQPAESLVISTFACATQKAAGESGLISTKSPASHHLEPTDRPGCLHPWPIYPVSANIPPQRNLGPRERALAPVRTMR